MREFYENVVDLTIRFEIIALMVFKYLKLYKHCICHQQFYTYYCNVIVSTFSKVSSVKYLYLKLSVFVILQINEITIFGHSLSENTPLVEI